jgi:hypothetical protein
MLAIRTRHHRAMRRSTYPALIVATQLLDAIALVLAWGHGIEANPGMAASAMRRSGWRAASRRDLR